MKFKKTYILEFDVKSEKNRINKYFKGLIKKKLHKIIDLFCEEKFQECLDVINTLGYSKEDHCKEIEFVDSFIADNIWDLATNTNVSLTKYE